MPHKLKSARSIRVLLQNPVSPLLTNQLWSVLRHADSGLAGSTGDVIILVVLLITGDVTMPVVSLITGDVEMPVVSLITGDVEMPVASLGPQMTS